MRLTYFGILILFAAIPGPARAGTAPEELAGQFFENKIRPILADTCFKCHSAQSVKLKGNLYLDSRDGILKGGDSGAAVVPGHSEQSKLAEAISWTNVDLQMPPKQKLSESQIADLTYWIKIGAPWPGSSAGSANPTSVKKFDLAARKASHWCWQPIRKVAVPAVKNAGWAQSPIDRFILAKLEEKGLTPAPQADRRILIRRAYFDLIGLPPTPQQVQAFVDDSSPTAFEKVVDQLLASDHFGERWARHWMDLVRYGETRGHEFDPLIPNAWQYRDYLIRAFNADVRYDQFVTEHLAGDLMPHPRLGVSGSNESVLGTGFWFLGEEVHSPVDIRQDEADRLNNRVDMMTKAFLGLTVGCARCHDHKFDAIGTRDFYALNGFLLSAGYRQVPFQTMEQNRQVAMDLDKLRAEARPRMLANVLAAVRPGLNHLPDYLLAGRQVILAGSQGESQISDIARRASLDPVLVRQWAVELESAAKNPGDPFHLFSLLSETKNPETLSRQIRKARNELNEAAARSTPIQVIVDFDSATAPWYADGVAFGLRPVRMGELLLGASADHPIEGIAIHGSARHDPAFPDLRHEPRAEEDAGKLGGWHRAGQTIRTPKVTLKNGKLWYLVRGAGRAYAVVDSHLVIQGPLHEKLLHEWPAVKHAGWTWVHQNLTEYAGQRCHIEFSPLPAGELEVACVIEADEPPALESPNAVLLKAIGDPAVDSTEALAGAYGKVFIQATDRLSSGNIAGTADQVDMAMLADFVVRRADLFCQGGTIPATVTESSRQFIAAQSALSAKIIAQSATAPAMLEGNGVDEHVLVRGQAKNSGDLVPRRFLEAIAGPNQKPYPVDGSGRMQLVDAMLAESNPFTSRVMVNRVWEHLFGRGIVPTVDNFGVLGQAPTHPELLDYLADHFRTEQAWSVKKLIKSIMLSSAYQMSSKAPPAADAADPENLTLHHMPIRRLEAEVIRDAILSVSGRLDPKIGGPPIEVYMTEFMDGRGRPSTGPMDGAGRRSIYSRVRRNFLSPMMLAFDMPIPAQCVGRRNVSNVPAQALILMNDPLVVQQAELWARHLLGGANSTADGRIRTMYLTAIGREPTPQELQDAASFLKTQSLAYGLSADQGMKDPRPWGDLCHVMFNLKEFIFIQ